MNMSEQANPKNKKVKIAEALHQMESFNYLNLQDSMVTQNTFPEEKSNFEENSKLSGTKRVSKGIIKVVHQISKYEEENNSQEENQSIDMTSQILAEEIFSPIVW